MRILRSIGLSLAALLLVTGTTVAQDTTISNLTGISTFCSEDGVAIGDMTLTIVNDDGLVQYNLTQWSSGNAEALASLEQLANAVCQMGVLAPQLMPPMPQEPADPNAA